MLQEIELAPADKSMVVDKSFFATAKTTDKDAPYKAMINLIKKQYNEDVKQLFVTYKKEQYVYDRLIDALVIATAYGNIALFNHFFDECENNYNCMTVDARVYYTGLFGKNARRQYTTVTLLEYAIAYKQFKMATLLITEKDYLSGIDAEYCDRLYAKLCMQVTKTLQNNELDKFLELFEEKIPSRNGDWRNCNSLLQAKNSRQLRLAVDQLQQTMNALLNQNQLLSDRVLELEGQIPKDKAISSEALLVSKEWTTRNGNNSEAPHGDTTTQTNSPPPPG